MIEYIPVIKTVFKFINQNVEEDDNDDEDESFASEDQEEGEEGEDDDDVSDDDDEDVEEGGDDDDDEDDEDDEDDSAESDASGSEDDATESADAIGARFDKLQKIIDVKLPVIALDATKTDLLTKYLETLVPSESIEPPQKKSKTI